MKKLGLLLLSIIVLNSCSVESDEGPNVNYELAEITKNDLPEEFERGKSYSVNVEYTLPTECSTFAYLDARREGNISAERRNIYVAAISSTISNANCDGETEGETGVSSFSILIDEREDYKFYFWKGLDATNQPIYEEVIVPVIEASGV